ncbi:MAG: 3-methyl-2-oxobutanoate dehydrogenase subunit beta [Thermoplasmata archaeon]|jgi:2-oxoisovalerate ferredoxin oxidoreductase beta subunit|nr:3-methyl-2-oxobutanoate dehydrogenase subunit beta [Thermoplasmata archaeon]
MTKTTIPEEEFVFPGGTGCPGCGANLVMRYLLKGLGERTILSIPACCWAVMPGYWPSNCLKVPLLYTAFEATGAAMSGLRAALDIKGVKDVTVVGFAGDGGTVDIGLQAMSGAAERLTDSIYVMYDNEAYMNTGIQRSGGTPWGAWTTTTPVGQSHGFKHESKKDIMAIMQAHRIPYAATVSPAFPEDFVKKVQKAKAIKGFRFLHALSPCPPGWRMNPSLSVEVARLAVDTRVFPLYEIEDGKVRITRKGKGLPLTDYLKAQGRFQHLTEEEISEMQKGIDDNWIRLLLKETSGT